MFLTTLEQLLGSLGVFLLVSLHQILVRRRAGSFSRSRHRPTYRVQNIPEHFKTRNECRTLIEEILSTLNAYCHINIRTFASSWNHRHGPTTESRTVTFDLIDVFPLSLKPNTQNVTQDEWSFKIPDSASQQIEEYLIIDTHFVGFTVLSSPEDGDHEFDVVAISGLGSHAWGSFKKRSQSSMWLADKLPQSWPQARIMIYGYRSPIVGSQSRKNLSDIAKTFSTGLVNMRNSTYVSPRKVPLVFVAHSLGGLVVKQALINLSKHRRTELGTQDPFQLTCAILFFGVPCRGLDGERLGLAAIARGQSTQGFLSDLRGDSPMVDDLAQDFIGKFQGRDTVQIFSFYETKESGTAIKNYFGRPTMNGPRQHWVPKNAAFNGRDVEREEDDKYSIPLDTDHSGLVKCEEEETFKIVSKVLNDLDWTSITRAMALYEKQKGNIVHRARVNGGPQYCNVVETLEDFIGRDDVIDDIHNKLGSNTSITPTLAIWGLSGIGKTETVLRYAIKYRAEYTTIYRFNARSEKDLTTSMVSFLDLLAKNHDSRLTDMAEYTSMDKCKAVKRWLEEERGWLIIYDDVDPEPDYEFSNYLPQHADGHQIIIGLDRRIKRFANDELRMTGMSDKDAMAMLLKRADFPKPTLQEKLDAMRIVHQLDKMPAFIEYAAAYIKDTNSSLETYLQILRTQKSNMILGHGDRNPGDKLASWELVYEKLQKYESSMILLKVFAFLDGSCISKELLDRGGLDCIRWSQDGTKSRRSPDTSDVDRTISSLLQDPAEFSLALKHLLDASFIRRERGENIFMPKLVQRLVIHRLDDDEVLSWTKKAICFVSHSFPEDDYLEQRFEALRSDFTPHVFRCMDHARNFPPPQLHDVTFQLVSMLVSVLAGSWKQMELVDYAKLLLDERESVYYRCLSAKWEAYMLWHKKATSDASALLARTRQREERRLAAAGTTLATDFLTGEVYDYRAHAALGDLAMHQAQFLFKAGLFKEGEIILKRWKVKSNSELELRTQLNIETALSKSLLCQGHFAEAQAILERLLSAPEARGTGEIQPSKYNWPTALLAQIYCANEAFGKPSLTIPFILPEVTFRLRAGLDLAYITSDYRLYLAEAYVRTHQYKDATNVLIKLESALRNPLQFDNPRAQSQLLAVKSLKARALYMQKSWPHARLAWLEYLSCVSVEESDITDLTWKRTYDIGIGIYSLAVVYYHLGQMEKAEHFIKIVRSDANILVYPAGEIDYTKWLQYLQEDYKHLRKAWVSSWRFGF